MSENAHPVCLVAFKTDGGKRVLALKPGKYTIGRHESAALRLPFPSVSRKHCELACQGEVLTVRDLGSANGTFRNSEEIPASTDVQLHAGDTLSVGPCRFVVQINGQPEHIPTPEEPGVDDLLDTPPSGSPAVDDRAPGSEVDADLDDTVNKPAGMKSLLSDNPEDSSVFDFDFDFEDDDNPKL